MHEDDVDSIRDVPLSLIAGRAMSSKRPLQSTYGKEVSARPDTLDSRLRTRHDLRCIKMNPSSNPTDPNGDRLQESL